MVVLAPKAFFDFRVLGRGCLDRCVHFRQQVNELVVLLYVLSAPRRRDEDFIIFCGLNRNPS